MVKLLQKKYKIASKDDLHELLTYLHNMFILFGKIIISYHNGKQPNGISVVVLGDPGLLGLSAYFAMLAEINGQYYGACVCLM